MRFGRHTAAYAKHQRRVLLFQVFELPDGGKRFVFGVLADGAGVNQNEIGLFLTLGRLISHFQRHARKFFTVRHILLTAKGQHKKAKRMTGLGGKTRKNRPVFFNIRPGIDSLPAFVKRKSLPRIGLGHTMLLSKLNIIYYTRSREKSQEKRRKKRSPTRGECRAAKRFIFRFLKKPFQNCRKNSARRPQKANTRR